MKRSTKMNLIFVAVVLAIAGVLFAIRGAKPAGNVAVLTYGFDQKTMQIPLNKDDRIDVETCGLTIHLQVEDGRIRFVDSPCPDHVCEAYGWLSEEGDYAACMPALAALIVQAG